MAIKIGSDTLVTAYRGTDQLSKIYRGSTQIWPTAPTGKSWTIDTWVLKGNGFYKDILPITTWTIDQGTGFTQKLY